METESDLQQENLKKEDSNSQTTTSTRKNKKSPYWIAASILSVVFILGVANYLKQDVQQGAEDIDTAQTANPTRVVAVVNGEEITQEVLNERILGAEPILASQGVDLENPEVRKQIEKQILDDTIGYYLLKQKAQEEGITVDSDMLEQTYAQYAVQAGGEEALSEQLQAINVTLQDFKNRLQEQLVLDAYLAKNVDMSGVFVSDQDVQDFYDAAVASQGGNPPNLEDIRIQIEEQLKAQQEQVLVQEFIDSLRVEAKIEIK